MSENINTTLIKHSGNNKTGATSLSLIPETFNTLGEEDRFEASELLRDDAGFVLEIILQNCNACLYVCCHQPIETQNEQNG